MGGFFRVQGIWREAAGRRQACPSREGPEEGTGLSEQQPGLLPAARGAQHFRLFLIVA